MEVFIKEPWANPTVYMVKHNITRFYFKQKVSIGKSDKTVYLTNGERSTIPWSIAKDSAGQEQGGSGSRGAMAGRGLRKLCQLGTIYNLARNYTFILT